MRVIKIVAVSSFIAGLSLGASQAGAGTPSTLAEGFWNIAGTTTAPATNNICTTGSDGGFFETFGLVEGSGTGGQIITLQYDTPQPTSVSRNDKKIAVKESSFSTLRAIGGAPAAFDTDDIVIEKCSVSGSVNTTKLTGSVSVSCSGTSLFGGVTADQAVSIQAAFNGAKNIKFKVNSNGKWSLKITCKGTAGLP